MSLPKAVVFDLDGTLIHSAPDLRAATNRLLVNEGRRELGLDEVISMVGDGVSKLVERAFRATGEAPDHDDLNAKVSEFLTDYEVNATVLTDFFPGARRALTDLNSAGVKLGLCTNKPEQATREILDKLGVAGQFEAVFGGDSLNDVRKPDPRHLLAVTEALGVEPVDVVMVGDGANDIDVAINAGVRSVAVSFGYAHVPVHELGADIVIDHFDDLLGALEKLA